jgi:hypothetical protein
MRSLRVNTTSLLLIHPNSSSKVRPRFTPFALLAANFPLESSSANGLNGLNDWNAFPICLPSR